MNEQMEAAFWKLLQKKPLNRITVSELIAEAHCNRSTFYYYFTDVEALSQSIIMKTVPEHIPHIAMLYMSGDIKNVDFDEEIKDAIEKISLLLRHSNSRHLVQLIENSIISLWCRQFGIEEGAASGDRLHTMQFLAGGIVSILSRYTWPLQQEEMLSCFKQINRNFGRAAITFIQER